MASEPAAPDLDENTSIDVPVFPAAATSGAALQVAYYWHRRLLSFFLLGRGQRASVGNGKRATFIAPVPPGQPAVRSFIRPTRRGHRLRLWPGMVGSLTVAGSARDVGELLSAPAPRRLLGQRSYREIDLHPGDSADVWIDEARTLCLRLGYVEPPPRLGRPSRSSERLLVRTALGTAACMFAIVTGLFLVGRTERPATVAIDAERFAKTLAPILEAPRMKETLARASADEQRRRKQREAAQTARKREAEGKLGRADAPARDTVMPKGRQDLLREKVARTGVLAVLGAARAPGSGMGKLLDPTSSDVEQALTGLQGAKLTAGRGTGAGNVGTGPGGGGKGFGRIMGAGEVDVGIGRGRGRKGPGLGTGKEREVQVGFETGNPDAEGGLTKEQINRVVRAHQAAIKYCYEKELQRQPKLSGRIDVAWTIRESGSVDRAKVIKSTLENRAVEGCIERQIKNWQFPRSNAETIVQSYPFLFKGAS